MFWLKHTFLCFLFCASCQITCSKIIIVGHNLTVYSGHTGCPAIQLTCQQRNATLTENFCIMNVKQEASSIGSCTTESGETFHFSVTNYGSEYEVMINKTVTNITMLFLPDQLQYLPSNVYQNLRGSSHPSFICLRDVGGILNVNKYVVDPQERCNVAVDRQTACRGNKGSKYVLHVNETQTTCVSCIDSSKTFSPSEASKMMDNLENTADEMEKNNQIIKPIVKEGVKGLVYRQDRNTEPKDIIMYSDQDEITVSEAQNITLKTYSWFVKISDEAFNKSRLENNRSTFVGVLQFKNMDVNDDDKTFTVLNNEVYGISMGANISNLTDYIEIFIQMQNVVGGVSCNSWDGRGNLTWTTFGCDTEIINKTNIKCSCSHLTFFAVLMTNERSNPVKATNEKWQKIFYIGCGLFCCFLFISLLMPILLRKNRFNQSTMIEMETQVCKSHKI